jgi:G6PDH family F420-dependent oxidoreductase
MLQVGFKLFAELFPPKELVRQAVRAERIGFDFVEISDHFHPWLDQPQDGPRAGHSGFAWSILGTIAACTERIELATGVTCPIMRYHPAIIAQAAATMAVLSDGRFTLGIGSGERLNEHITGEGWPGVRVRHQRLREALQIIRRLWSGGLQHFDGKYLTLDSARIYDLPERLPLIAVAASGPASARIAGELGDALFAVAPDPALTKRYAEAGGRGPKYAEMSVAWARTEEVAIRAARKSARFMPLGPKVNADLPRPSSFEQVGELISEEELGRILAYGPDPAEYIRLAQTYVDAGFDRLSLINVGPDIDGFFDFAEEHLIDQIRSLHHPADARYELELRRR